MINKFKIIKKCIYLAKLKYKKINLIDGVRVSEKKGWWLLRASNTQPAIIIRCEANNKKDLINLIDRVNLLINEAGLKTNLRKFL